MQLKWLLSHTRGYLELGMTAEAADELARVPESSWNDREVRILRALILQEQKAWAKLMPLAAELAHDEPGEAGWWIMLGYATRRGDSLESAEAVLLNAEAHHPNEATIQFNLGCYACQRGDLKAARRRVDRAIELDPSFRDTAATDPDLAPLRAKQQNS